MSERETIFWRRLRDIALCVMTVSAAVAGIRFDWLPSKIPDVCAILTAVAGGLSTLAANRLPSSKAEKPKPKEG